MEKLKLELKKIISKPSYVVLLIMFFVVLVVIFINNIKPLTTENISSTANVTMTSETSTDLTSASEETSISTSTTLDIKEEDEKDKGKKEESSTDTEKTEKDSSSNANSNSSSNSNNGNSSNSPQNNSSGSKAEETKEPDTAGETENEESSIDDSSSKIEDLGTTLEERKDTVDNSKEKLVEIVNEDVVNAIENDDELKKETDSNDVDTLHKELIKKIDSSLPKLNDITSSDINNLKTEVKKGIEDITKTTKENQNISEIKDRSIKNVATTLDLLSESISNQTESLRKQEADLLYKDTNEDGISDYDSLYVYNIDPILPSVDSVYNGKTIKAGEKILLGFDPSDAEIKEVNKEEPEKSEAKVIRSYKVKEVALTEKKEVVFKGQALPNSFITLYIYSTPIIVTVKTDSNGEWQYVLDKELENGEHTIYTATVNNSGNIIAKSSPYLFTKTAEAATLKDIPLVDNSSQKPGLLEGDNLYIIFVSFVLIIIITLILIGTTNKKEINK